MNLGLTALDPGWGSLVFILVAGWLPNDLWRVLGVVLAGRLSDESAVFGWIKAVATALVAGVIGQLVLVPAGALANTPLWLRLAAVATGFAAYQLRGHAILAGVLAGELVFILGYLALGL